MNCVLYIYLAHEGHEEAVYNESRSVAAVHGALADLLTKLRHLLHDDGIGVHGLDDLEQLHHLHGVEEVQAHELVGSAGCHRHVGNGQGGGVRGEHAGGLDQRAQLLVEVDLDVLLLDNSLLKTAFFQRKRSNKNI